MKRTLTLVAILLLTAVSALPVSQVIAGPYSYVSQLGDDGHNCSGSIPTLACKSLDVALTKTDDGGVVICVDPGSYFSFEITKGVTIDCLAGGGSSFQGFNINAPGKTVTLRNFNVNGYDLGGFAKMITLTSAAQVYLENVSVTASGGSSVPGLADTRSSGSLVIKNSSFTHITGVGILIAPTSGGSIAVDLDNVTSSYNRYGVAVGTGGRVAVARSTFSGNSTVGVEADAGGQIALDSSSITNNPLGIQSSMSVRLSNNNIAYNATAISGNTGSFGGNRLSGNTSDGTPPTPMGAASSDFAQK